MPHDHYYGTDPRDGMVGLDLLTRGRAVGGDYLARPLGPDGPTSSGSITYYDTRIVPYLGDVRDGGWVVDKKALQDDDRFLGWVIASPMVDVRLRPGEVLRFDGAPAWMMSEGGVQGVFRDLLAIKEADPQYGGLDYVSVEGYAGWWSLRGARVGRRVGSEIHWEDGARTPIPAVQDRWTTPDL